MLIERFIHWVVHHTFGQPLSGLDAATNSHDTSPRGATGSSFLSVLCSHQPDKPTSFRVLARLQVRAEYDDPVIAALQTLGERLWQEGYVASPGLRLILPVSTGLKDRRSDVSAQALLVKEDKETRISVTTVLISLWD